MCSSLYWTGGLLYEIRAREPNVWCLRSGAVSDSPTGSRYRLLLVTVCPAAQDTLAQLADNLVSRCPWLMAS